MRSNFSFSHSVFYPLIEVSATLTEFKIVVLQTLSVWKSLKFVVWERVNSTPNDTILAFSILKEIADDITNVARLF